MVIMQRLLARMRACLQTAWLPQLHLCYIESEGHFCIAALCCYCLESYCFAVVPLYLPLMSAGPIAESYNPFGMMFPKASYVIGAVIRFTLSLRTCRAHTCSSSSMDVLLHPRRSYLLNSYDSCDRSGVKHEQTTHYMWHVLIQAA
eukprot:GHUV01045623.1.p1 GENE.GHUV01045623.1~~GHUV01045623.1.p1  ORF type:complete len:146 (-),score=23.03 GHUV01045623.1:68-505(-)